VITGAQIRAARALLKWSAEEAAKHAKVGRKTIERLEQCDGIPATRQLTIESVRKSFEEAGVEFIDENGGGPGVRLRKRSRSR
jgi:transcriptional regulator with XRE-family HTH domain